LTVVTSSKALVRRAIQAGKILEASQVRIQAGIVNAHDGIDSVVEPT